MAIRIGKALIETRAAEPNRLNLAWLIRLRWGVVAGQTLLVLGAHLFLDLHLPFAALGVPIALGGLSNFALALWARGARATPNALLAGVMALDFVLLTALLLLSGGTANPFTNLYLVNLALAAVVLPGRWAWPLTGFGVACFASLFFARALPIQAPGLSHAEQMELHLKGMWLSFSIATGFILYFVQRVTRALAENEQALEVSRSLAARQEKLASLATLAAGAAHELSTPLATIAVAAHEMELSLERERQTVHAQDAALIHQQVLRCREILGQMAVEAGAPSGESLVELTVETAVREALSDLAEGSRVEIAVEPSARGARVGAPPRALARTLQGLTKNALQASPQGAAVTVTCGLDSGHVRIAISDQGSGMNAEVLRRAGEPFFTTKLQGQGMGLGLFLARALASQLGGELQLSSRVGAGTVATLVLPTA
jgi:two-component system sensor histidine kinase RegB